MMANRVKIQTSEEQAGVRVRRKTAQALNLQRFGPKIGGPDR